MASKITSVVLLVGAVTIFAMLVFCSAEDSNEVLSAAEGGYRVHGVPRRPYGAFGLRGGIGLGYGVYANGRGFGAHVGAAIGHSLGDYNRGHQPFQGWSN